MRLRRKILIAVLSIAAAGLWLPLHGQKNAAPFRPKPASDYPSHQTIGPLKLAAVAYETDGDTKPLFGGKVNPNEYGALPILLLLENTGDETYLLDRLQILYRTSDGQKIEPTKATDLPYLIGVKRPSSGVGYPSPIPLPKRKNPLSAIEFDLRAWAAKMLLKRESAHGFLYFQTRHGRNSILYVSGIREASTGKEVFFAEIPIDQATEH